MSGYEELVSSAVQRLAAERGVTQGVATMHLMMLAAMAMARDLPECLHQELVDAQLRWFVQAESPPALEPGRARAWDFLKSKNGYGTVVVDDTDIAVRTLICVLWDEAREGPDVDDMQEFFAQLAERYGGLERVLGLPEPQPNRGAKDRLWDR